MRVGALSAVGPVELDVLFTTAALSIPAGASSGVAVVTTGSACFTNSETGWVEEWATGWLENSATGTCSAGPVGVLDFPQLQGAYHDP